MRATVLVTGIGAPGGLTIQKALRFSELDLKIVGSDLHPWAVGSFFADEAYRLPRVSDPSYLQLLQELCVSENVDAVFIGAEPEIRFLLPHIENLETSTGSKFVLSRPELVEACMDKFETARLLESHGFRGPRTVLGSDDEAVHKLVEELGFPLFIKPRFGSGSQHSYKISNDEELEFFRKWVPGAVVQEYLGEADQEYTVGLYIDGSGRVVGSIASRRDLAAGLTYRAYFDDYPDLRKSCEEVARAIRPKGPCNMQLRKAGDDWVIFEINPRCSSSTVMRAAVGFNEPEMAIRDLVFGEELPRPELSKAVALRFWEEAYVLAPEGDEPGFGKLRLPEAAVYPELMKPEKEDD